MSTSAIRPSQRGDLAMLTVCGTHADVTAAVQGAQVLEWAPRGERPVLFLSPRSHYKPGRAIRGGVPLCFPWFGANPHDPQAPAHGFARTQDWVVERAEVEADGAARLAFTLASSSLTRAVWPHEFVATLRVRATNRLHLALEVKNTGAGSMTFTAALHTYLAVSDVRTICVHGLEGTDYLDRAGGGSIRRREGDTPVQLVGEVDRTYLATTATCTIDDPGWKRRISIAKTGSRSTVLWNPAADKARALADLGEEAWPDFVCVETCNAGDDAITLAPGTTHTLAAEIRVEARS